MMTLCGPFEMVPLYVIHFSRNFKDTVPLAWIHFQRCIRRGRHKVVREVDYISHRIHDAGIYANNC